ncbi:hypothetical protein J31TS4_33800 [Paenibacillus sp. J31TS4]|uniref:spore coat protein n=1 Tax=Paenibacillus sp. J31TS4 TaxID=2807195 RepID=UPI001B111D54|nr:spore coat protein [Paenibacillus sp. J31TS4]GIP40100.1 hypothetical protein J31TS4_33800 [Paenibacillus sp. J31TS4]
MSGVPVSPHQDREGLTHLLEELKRTTLAYTTAAADSHGPAVRRLFGHLLASTLELHSELHAFLVAERLLASPPPAEKAEISRLVKHHQRSEQETLLLVERSLNGPDSVEDGCYPS